MTEPHNEKNAMRWGGRAWHGLGLASFLVAVGGLACARMDASSAFEALQIVQVQVLSDSDCNVPYSRTSLTRTSGILDIDLPLSKVIRTPGSPPEYQPRLYTYRLPILVVNNLASVGGGKSTELNNITLTHFTVELSANGVTWTQACPARFDTPKFTQLLEPAMAVGSVVTVISAYHAECMKGAVAAAGLRGIDVTATVWAKGIHGGTTLESAPFKFAIQVCAGCLQKYNDPALASFNNLRYPPCALLSGSNPYPGDRCFEPGQDKTIICCGIPQSDGTTTVLCPAVGTGSTDTSTSTQTTITAKPAP